MKLYNSLTRSIETFDPRSEPIGIYVCGITPYDTTHLGHAFTYTMADILIRYLEFQGRRVRYVQNVTDVDDDLLREAKVRGEDWRRMGNRWTAHYIEDMTAMNVRPPDDLPRATDVIPQIIETIGKLLEAGKAYISGGGVYFDLEAWPEYGRLSRLPRDQMLAIANERGNHPDDLNKRQPLDFVLWQAQSPGEPAWDSPWSRGRPGWHIECSTMSTHVIGHTLDLHAGGGDLIFPHHESEIAQIEPLTGQPFARHWMHVAMVQHRGAKMSKSLGNLVLLRDLLDRWPPDAIRLYLAGNHYRTAWSHDESALDIASRQAEVLAQAAAAATGTGAAPDPSEFVSGLGQAMENDLDTPAAIMRLSQLAEAILAASGQGGEVTAAQLALGRWGGVLGLRLGADSPETSVVEGWRRHLARFRSGEES